MDIEYKNQNGITNNPLHLWFIYLFDQKKDNNGYIKCFECGKKMHENTYKYLTTCYSHILAKKDYDQYKGCEWNVKIVHPDCHYLYSMSPKKAKKQYALYLELLEKHKNNEL